MRMNVEAALVRAIAPPDLADSIIGDLHENRAACARTRGDLVRSLLALLAYNASQALADNWLFAFAAASVTCVLCVAAIPLWSHIGLGGAVYHALRLAIIGLVLGCIPRASILSCVFLLMLIGASDCFIDARETGNGWHVVAEGKTYLIVLQDGIIMASMLVSLQIIRLIRRFSTRSGG